MLKFPEISKEGLTKLISPYKNVIQQVNTASKKSLPRENKKTEKRENKQNYTLDILKIINVFDKIKDIKLPNFSMSNLSIKNFLIRRNKTEKNSRETRNITFAKNNFQKINGLIKINSISKNFGENNVLNNISLIIPQGKIFGLVGVSGSGKTTLLKIIVGFYKPSKGNVVLDGKDTMKFSKTIRRSFGFGSQENCFYGGLNVQENVKYFAELYGLTDEYIDARMENVLSLVGLYDSRNTLADNLSTGMKRRLDLACSLIHDPNIVILDEPTEDLDLNLRKEILSLIKKINKEGKTVIMTSHLLGEIENVCHNVGIISNGKLIKYGSPEDLKREYTKDYEIHLQTESRNYNSLLKCLKVDRAIKKGKGVIIYVKDGEKTLRKIIARAKQKKDKIINIKLSRPSLSEVFQVFTKDAKKE